MNFKKGIVYDINYIAGKEMTIIELIPRGILAGIFYRIGNRFNTDYFSCFF